MYLDGSPFAKVWQHTSICISPVFRFPIVNHKFCCVPPFLIAPRSSASRYFSDLSLPFFLPDIPSSIFLHLVFRPIFLSSTLLLRISSSQIFLYPIFIYSIFHQTFSSDGSSSPPTTIFHHQSLYCPHLPNQPLPYLPSSIFYPLLPTQIFLYPFFFSAFDLPQPRNLPMFHIPTKSLYLPDISLLFSSNQYSTPRSFTGIRAYTIFHSSIFRS